MPCTIGNCLLDIFGRAYAPSHNAIVKSGQSHRRGLEFHVFVDLVKYGQGIMVNAQDVINNRLCKHKTQSYRQVWFLLYTRGQGQLCTMYNPTVA